MLYKRRNTSLCPRMFSERMTGCSLLYRCCTPFPALRCLHDSRNPRWDTVLCSAQLHGLQCNRCTYSVVKGREVAAGDSQCAGIRDPLKYALQKGTVGELTTPR
jgi:hypothetical protein